MLPSEHALGQRHWPSLSPHAVAPSIQQRTPASLQLQKTHATRAMGSQTLIKPKDEKS